MKKFLILLRSLIENQIRITANYIQILSFIVINSVNGSIEITLLYSIITDYAQDFQLDKINFNYKNIQQSYNDLNDSQIIQNKGYFGELKNIEREIQNELKKEVDLREFLKQSEKGNLIVIKFQNTILYCLILPTKFFTKRPIYEKSIEIVLFRILHDFTDNIKLCLDEEVFTDWYTGDIVPFSAQLLERDDYDFAEANNKDRENYKCQYQPFEDDISKCQIIKSQSQLPQVYIIEKLEINKIEQLLSTYNTFTESLMIQIITTQNNNVIPLINTFEKQHQVDKLKYVLNELSQKLQKEITHFRENLIQDISKELKSWYHFFNPKEQQAKQIVTQTFQTVKLPKDKNQPLYFQLNQEKQKLNKLFQIHLQNIYNKTKEIQSMFENQIKQLFQELCQQTRYLVKKIDFKVFRINENIDERILNIWPFFDNQYVNLDSSFIKNQSLEFQIKEIFSTNKKATIFIVYTQTMAYILYWQFQAPQVKMIRQQDIKEMKQSVYYYDYNLGYLYVFNHRNKFGNQFSIDQVAYINVCKKFIVLAKNNQIYIQAEKEQKFNVLKCLQETENKIRETEFTPSMNTNQNYRQLLTCASGKYFYLANYSCCDRYDITGKKLQTIPIVGVIQIFSDSSDVIIFDSFNQQSLQKQKNIQVISNLIQQKTFHKQQNDKKQIVGNPALDIVKGSFIKFGPNAQFLYKQKQRNINLYVEPHRYNQMEQYINNLNLNIVNLSNKEINSSECDCNQIMNIIFSRVPLQLCTIENGILIALNDHFE
ncbi:unnamed protein product [Paramecium sonneborni]|uniref:Uncharacterized protein n=1 Tax=Paramecium sonneborni TaxID=65129 RepID=A0A8S1RA92_9CILI|nr:unnamed protein product [Paramecium sonneborni]